MHGELANVMADDPKAQKLIESIEKMIEQVANSTDEAAKQSFIRNFFEFAGKFYNYSLHNQMLIWVQTRGRANHVAGARQWEQKFGRTVKDWASAITILAPIKKDKESLNSGTGEMELRQRVFFTTKKVYDVSSTIPIPGHPKSFEPVSRKQWSVDSNEDVEEIKKYISALDSWVQEKSIKINYEELDAETGGYSAGGKIAINSLFKGVNLFSTYVHEVAHELLHWEKDGKKATKKDKEIDAETTAFIVLNHFGFETKDTSNYLALWQAKGDDIRARRRNIQKAAMEIINGIKGKISPDEKIQDSSPEHSGVGTDAVAERANRMKADIPAKYLHSIENDIVKMIVNPNDPEFSANYPGWSSDDFRQLYKLLFNREYRD